MSTFPERGKGTKKSRTKTENNIFTWRKFKNVTVYITGMWYNMSVKRKQPRAADEGKEETIPYE